jgi:hypothetical protein
MTEALKVLLSFLRFAAETSPEIVPALRNIARAWATDKAIPHAVLLPALDHPSSEKAAAVDREVDDMIRRLWGGG